MDYKELSENEIFVVNEELLKKLGSSSKKEKKPYGSFIEDFVTVVSDKEKITYN